MSAAAEGEEPQHAVSVTEANVLDLIEQVLRMSTTTEITKEYLLTALAKLTERFRGVRIWHLLMRNFLFFFSSFR